MADPDKAKRFPELPYLTLRLAYMACEYFNADLGLAIVRAEHQAFYRRVFLHETIAEPRMLPGLLKPVGLMAADFPALKEKVFERYPMMRSTAFERRMLFDRAAATARPRRTSWSPRTTAPRSCRTPERTHDLLLKSRNIARPAVSTRWRAPHPSSPPGGPRLPL